MRACAVTLHDNRFAAAAAKGARRASPQHWPQQEISMADFIEQDLETPTEADLDSAYGSKFLSSQPTSATARSAARSLKVRKEAYCAARTTRARNGSCCISKGATSRWCSTRPSKDALVGALGKAPANWINASVGIYVDPNVMFGGVRTGGLRLRVLGPTVPPPQGTGAEAASAQKTTWTTKSRGEHHGPGRCAAAPALLMGSQYATRF